MPSIIHAESALARLLHGVCPYYRDANARQNSRRGTCQVTALDGPIRSVPPLTIRTDFGGEYQDYAWPFIEADWQRVGIHPGGITGCCATNVRAAHAAKRSKRWRSWAHRLLREYASCAARKAMVAQPPVTPGSRNSGHQLAQTK